MKYLFITFLLAFSLQLTAQEYAELMSEDDITIEYKWRKKKRLKSDSPYVMYMKLINSGIQTTKVRFELLYYREDEIISRSGVMEYCLKPEDKIKGKPWDLVFQSDIRTLEQIHDPSFTWDVNMMLIDKNSDCETGLKLRFVPRHRMKCSRPLETGLLGN